MCWSSEASALLATVGLSGTAYLATKGDTKELWIPLGYFSLMEALQAFTYPYINMCDSPVNQVLTVLGFMHIAFQPFFINAVSLYFIPEKVKKKVAPFAYFFCFIGAIILLLKLYPFQLTGNWMSACVMENEAICGTSLCSVSGSWHIAWGIPLNDMPKYIYSLAYYTPAFFIPLLYGSWRMTTYHFLVGPFLAYFLTSNPNEWPAVWCLFSAGLILAAIVTPLRKHLRVQKWYFWKYHEKQRL
ncbi:hypothetical protein COY07_05835 [Candidatus Peregrinibacteria bacterium CG_4_10_14_0_2_um_filter_43_11]|nr:MAG: hypothetical protein COY07_05835 [Candidatus Peregrinibacteria bacterium CG_4_10_14_0_2_um_filter_43_11]